jgi:hypothetical protein
MNCSSKVVFADRSPGIFSRDSGKSLGGVSLLTTGQFATCFKTIIFLFHDHLLPSSQSITSCATYPKPAEAPALSSFLSDII